MIEYTESSGNVFADLGAKYPEEALAKAELTQLIAGLIKKQQLSQKQAAETLEIDQSKISALIRGRLKDFSLEHLIRFLNQLGQDVNISISLTKFAGTRGHIQVSESQNTHIAILENGLHFVKKINSINGYKISITFNDNKTKIVDLEPFLDRGIMLPLRNPSYFNKVKIKSHTLAWPNEVDFCPDVLYDIGEDV